MAHYLAIHGSRWLFSHETINLPVYGMEGILKDESVIMTFKKRGDELVPSHQAHDYLYRAKELEDECLFSFHERYQTVSCAKAEDMESFHFTEEHVFHDSRVVVSRGSKIAIPVFHFRWVGYPKDFITPLSTRSVAGDADYELKEQYCLRMMILFYPYRSLDDLILNDCHQDAFMAAILDFIALIVFLIDFIFIIARLAVFLWVAILYTTLRKIFFLNETKIFY
jgi:hypothetical protein